MGEKIQENEDRLEGKFEGINDNFDSINDRIESLEDKISELEGKIESVSMELAEVRYGASKSMDDIADLEINDRNKESRIKVIEGKIGKIGEK